MEAVAMMGYGAGMWGFGWITERARKGSLQ